MKLFLLFLLITSAKARILKVKDNLRSYELKFSPDAIDLSAKGLDFTFTKKACNQKILLQFSSSVETQLNRLTKLARPDEHVLTVNDDGKEYYVNTSSPGGQYLRLIPEYIQELALKEKLYCR